MCGPPRAADTVTVTVSINTGVSNDFWDFFTPIMTSGKIYETSKTDGTVGGHIYSICQTETDDEIKPKDQAI